MTSTVLTLFVVPVVYSLLDDLARRVQKSRHETTTIADEGT